MAQQPSLDSSESFEAAYQEQNTRKYILRLFIIGNTPKSTIALLNLHELCERELAGCYQLEVIDIRQQPAKARSEQIVATPTLIKTEPPPIRRIVGDFSKREKVMAGLGLV